MSVLLKKAVPSANTVFPLLGLRPLVCKWDFREAYSADTPAPTIRVAASPSGFKSVRRREHNNVIRNWEKDIKTTQRSNVYGEDLFGNGRRIQNVY